MSARGEARFDRDLTALISLFRPAPRAYIEAYARRKHGAEAVEYLHPLLEPILAETYGLIVYQEQVMRIGAEIGGMPLDEADVMRNLIWKGLADRVSEFEREFIDGAADKGMDETTAKKVFAKIARSAAPAHAFNKGHAVSYARISYQTAFMKANCPLEYITAFLNTHTGDKHACQGLLEDAAEMGMRVDPPDINADDAACTIQNGRVRLGLSTIEHCSDSAVSAILESRDADGPFRDLFDIPSRLDRSVLDRKAFLALIASGALGSLPGTMAQKFAAAEDALRLRGTPRSQEKAAQLPENIDSFDLLREIASVHRHAARDLSFDVYCPKAYTHHFRLTMWLPPESVIFDMEISQLIEQARLFAGYFESERNDEYAIGLNSRVNQYAEKHLLMLDLDSVDDAAIERLSEYGGYLLRSGRGYHFIGKAMIPNLEQWHETLRSFQKMPELRDHIDNSHIEMSLKRGYSTLRILESPAKPRRPVMIRML